LTTPVAASHKQRRNLDKRSNPEGAIDARRSYPFAIAGIASIA
jgi:hypothetical protein